MVHKQAKDWQNLCLYKYMYSEVDLTSAVVLQFRKKLKTSQSYFTFQTYRGMFDTQIRDFSLSFFLLLLLVFLGVSLLEIVAEGKNCRLHEVNDSSSVVSFFSFASLTESLHNFIFLIVRERMNYPKTDVIYCINAQ